MKYRVMATIVVAACGWSALACADEPTSPAVSSAEELQMPANMLGGEAALAGLRAYAERLSAEGRLAELPENAIKAAFGIRDELDEMPLRLLTGPYVEGGTEYYEEGGEFYPPEEKEAFITEQYTASGPLEEVAFIWAGFRFVGHEATQETSFSARLLSTGETFVERTVSNFGTTGEGNSKELRQFSGQYVENHPYECGYEVRGNTNHEAWYKGFWIPELVYGANGELPVIRIKVVMRKTGLKPAGSTMDPTALPCEGDQEPSCGDEEPSEGGGNLISPTGTARLDCSGDPGGGGGENEFGCYYCEWEGDIIYYPYTDTWDIEITYENCSQVDDSYCIDNS